MLHNSQLQDERIAVTNGEVTSTDVIHSTSGGKHKHKTTSYYATVKYFDEYATTSEKTVKIQTNMELSKGDKITIKYGPNNQDNAVILESDHGIVDGVGSIFLIIFGGAWIGITVFITKIRNPKPE